MPLFKKGAINKCKNWRGISLLSVTSKILAQIILTRVVSIIDKHLEEAQAGFRKGRSCVDQIFSLRCISEKTKEMNLKLWLCFIDLKAAYDKSIERVYGRYWVNTEYRNT